MLARIECERRQGTKAGIGRNYRVASVAWAGGRMEVSGAHEHQDPIDRVHATEAELGSTSQLAVKQAQSWTSINTSGLVGSRKGLILNYHFQITE